MKKNTPKLIVAWVVGLIVFGLLLRFGYFIADEINLRTLVDWGETRITFVDNQHGIVNENDGETTPLGWWIAVISIFMAARVGMAIYHGNLRGNVSTQSEFGNLLIIACFTLWALLSSLLDIVFGDEVAFFGDGNLLYTILKISVFFGCGYLYYISETKFRFLTRGSRGD